jgi:hypothetical protein
MTDSDRERDTAEPELLEDEVERTRRLILERRNRFMAAALAGLGMASGGCAPSVCLSPPFEESGSGGGGSGGTAGIRPSVCLSGRSAPPPVGGVGGGGNGGTSGIRPSVCLSGSGAPFPCTPGAQGCEPDDGGMDDGGEEA